MAERNGMRTTSIFRNKILMDEQQMDSNLRKSPIAVSPRPVSPYAKSPKALSPNKVVSPIKIKAINIDHNYEKSYPANSLTTKIALSNNKISQIEKKINKLKL
jgi:hypothetical protein